MGDKSDEHITEMRDSLRKLETAILGSLDGTPGILGDTNMIKNDVRFLKNSYNGLTLDVSKLKNESWFKRGAIVAGGGSVGAGIIAAWNKLSGG